MCVDVHTSANSNNSFQALPFLLKDFIAEEVEEINKILRQNEVDKPPVKDPSGRILHVLNAWLDWYNHIRQPLSTSQDLREIALKSAKLLEMLKLVFPRKSGTDMICLLMCPL